MPKKKSKKDRFEVVFDGAECSTAVKRIPSRTTINTWVRRYLGDNFESNDIEENLYSFSTDSEPMSKDMQELFDQVYSRGFPDRSRWYFDLKSFSHEMGIEYKGD